MGRLYNRKCSLSIYKPSGYFDDGNNAIRISDLRVTFRVEKSLQKEPNTAEIEVYNLNQGSRALTQTKPIAVRLEAGYDGNTELLFVGDVNWASSKLGATDWVTRLQCGDGSRAFNFARINKSYRAGTPAVDVLKDVAGSMGLKVPTSAGEAVEFAKQFVSGKTSFGSSSLELDRIVKNAGRSWSVQNGKLQIVKDGVPIGRTQYTISEDTGMIGSPEYGAPRNAKETPTITVRMLLHPGLAPGGLARIKSREVSGDFRIEKVSHSGDSQSQDWTTTIEAKHL